MSEENHLVTTQQHMLLIQFFGNKEINEFIATHERIVFHNKIK